MRYLKRQSLLILVGVFLLFGALVSGIAQAQGPSGAERGTKSPPIDIQTEIVIPGQVPVFDDGLLRGKVDDLADYLGIIYQFLISIVGVVAGVFILVGGFQYLTAGGDAGRVTSAKRRIGNALIGFILALSSYVLLNTINPELVNLKLPQLVKVSTELSFLPFCDDLAKRLNIEFEEITRVGPYGGNGTNNCGNAGFYAPPEQQQGEGTPEIAGVKGKSGRLWCVLRGKHLTGSDRPANHYADYGCTDGSAEDDGIIFNGSFPWLSICYQKANIDVEDLEKDYEDNKMVNQRLARCIGCVNLIGDSMRRLDNMSGDRGCLAWQNTANNGNPNDFNWSYRHKVETGVIQDTRKVGNDDRAGRMYYCGYSPSKDRCIYTPLNCFKVSSCSDYSSTDGLIWGDGNSFTTHYCTESGPGTEECHGSEKLASKVFTDTGSAHLLPICNNDPCDVERNCHVPGLGQFENVGGSTIRVGVRIMTAGLAGGLECK